MDRTADRTLITRLQAEDPQAVRELAEKYGPRIFQLAMRQLRNEQDAEEVTQDVLLKVYRKVSAFRGDSALSSWIYRITFNAAMSRLRASRLSKAADRERDRLLATDDEREGRLLEQPDWSAVPDEVLLRSQLRRAVSDAISDLPEIYRVPIVLRDIHGLTTEEAGRRLKLKDQTLKSRLHRGRLLLREKLRNFQGGMVLHPRIA